MFTLSNAFYPYIGGPGLSVSIDAGFLFNAGGSTLIPAQTISLAANSTTYIFMNLTAIQVQSNNSGFPSNGAIPIAIVTTNNSGVVQILDMRPDFGGAGSSAAISRWDQLQSAQANLTLNNAGFSTTFNQTSSAVTWTWANTTAAASNTPTNSPTLNLASTIWNGSASVADTWTLQNVPDPTINNGTTTLKLTHSGTAGMPMFSVGDANSLSSNAHTFFQNGSLNVLGPLEACMAGLQVFSHAQGPDVSAAFIINDYTAFGDTCYGLSVWNFVNNTTGSDLPGSASYGCQIQVEHKGANAVGTLIALDIDTESDGTQTNPITQQICLFVGGNLSPIGGPLTTTTYGIKFDDQNGAGAAGHTNYGIYFPTQTTTGGTTTWAIYEVDTSCVNQLGPTTFLTVPTLPAQTANFVFAGPTTGAAAAPTFRALVAADIPSGTVTWDAIGNAGNNLTLANAGFTTTFNQTSAVNWTWANTTAATSGTSQSSPIWNLNGTYWTGSASATDGWSFQTVIGSGTNGTTNLQILHSGSSSSTQKVSFVNSTTGPFILWNNVNAATFGCSSGILNITDGNSNVVLGSGSINIGNKNALFFNITSPDLASTTYNATFLPSSFGNKTFSLGGDTSTNVGDKSGYLMCQNIQMGQPKTQHIAGNPPIGILSGTGLTVGNLSNVIGIPTVTVQTGSGATTWAYKVVAKDVFGNTAIASVATSVSNNATLNLASAINKIAIARIAGAYAYDVYRTTAGTSPSTTGLIGTIPDANVLDSSLFLFDFGAVTLTAAGNASNGYTTYTFASSGQSGSNNLLGCTVTIAGFTNGGNNGTFTIVASSSTTFTVINSGGISESASATATQTGSGAPPVANTTGNITLQNTTPTIAPALTLSQVTVSGGSTTYTGTITGGGNNAYVGATVAFSGFTNGGNNTTATVTASTTTTLVVNTSTQVNETHAGSAISSAATFSPLLEFLTTYEGAGNTPSTDTWSIQTKMTTLTGNPVSQLTFSHTGTTGAANWNIINTTNFSINTPNWSIGFNSSAPMGNRVSFSSTTTNWGLQLSGVWSNNVAIIGVSLGGGTWAASPAASYGITYALSSGNVATGGFANTFQPTTGSTKYVAAGFGSIINETSSNTSDYTILQVVSQEQAFLGTNSRLAEFGLGWTITNVAETAGNVVTLTVSNNTAVVGQTIFLEGLGTATWLNGLLVTLTAPTNSTTLTFTDPTSHGLQASHAETGRATLTQLGIDTTGKMKTYNGETTAGVGTSYLRGSTTQKSETGADTNVLTVTPASVAGTYRISIVMSVSAANTATLGWTATWTDSNSHAQAPTNLSLATAGSATLATTVSAAANGTYYGEWYVDVDSSGTAIVVKTTFAGTSIAYKASAYIERVA